MENVRSTGFSRLMEIAGARRGLLMVSGFFAVLSSILALAPYGLIYLVMVRLLEEGSSRAAPYVFGLGLFALGAVFLRYLFLFVAIMFSHVAAFGILYDLRATLTRHLGRLPMGCFTGGETGKIKKILFEDVEEIEVFIAHHIPDMVAAVALPVLTLGFLFTVDWRMALVSLMPLPIAFAMQRRAFGGDQAAVWRRDYHDALETMNSTIVEYVRAMPVVKIFNQSAHSFARLREATLAYTDFIRRITRIQAPPWAAFVVITSSSLFFILPAGLWLHLEGRLSLSVFFLFLMMGPGCMTPLFRLAMLGAQMGHILEGMNRMDAILLQPEIPEPQNPLFPRSAAIRFENVTFAYGRRPVLQDFSLSLEAGGVYALVGPSGAGKTTIGQLLLRMWDVDSGRILLGGVDIREMPREALMRHVGFVFQEVFMFSDTIYENIRMGMEGVSEADIERAARAAQCMEFIERLPKGFETRIGEGGEVHLSGGERQRISLARVFLKNAPVLVLDEATAYADAQNESKIQGAFSEIMKGKTVIVIAHRLSSITDADRIFVIREGRLAEAGLHGELLEKKSLYHSMWQAHIQAQGWALRA